MRFSMNGKAVSPRETKVTQRREMHTRNSGILMFLAFWGSFGEKHPKSLHIRQRYKGLVLDNSGVQKAVFPKDY